MTISRTASCGRSSPRTAGLFPSGSTTPRTAVPPMCSRYAKEPAGRPRTRGCSRQRRGDLVVAGCRPAYEALFPQPPPPKVNENRPRPLYIPGHQARPRARGAVPKGEQTTQAGSASSPRTRAVPARSTGKRTAAPSSPRKRSCSAESEVPAHANSGRPRAAGLFSSCRCTSCGGPAGRCRGRPRHDDAVVDGVPPSPSRTRQTPPQPPKSE